MIAPRRALIGRSFPLDVADVCIASIRIGEYRRVVELMPEQKFLSSGPSATIAKMQAPLGE